MAQLIAECDIFAENYVPGKLAKYKLSYDDVKSINSWVKLQTLEY